MRNSAFKRALSAILVMCLLVPMITVAASAASTGEKSYAEENGWLNENPNATDDYAYSIAVVGDTQSMVKVDLTNGTNYMSSIYNWIANNATEKNIQYVLGVGDITEYTENFDSSFDGSWTYADEWIHAKNAITLLDNKVPYSLCRGGGHDTASMFNEYFASHDYYTSNLAGQMTAGDVCNTYSTFEVGNVKYLILALDWNPSDATLAWAEGIVAANADRRVIITTHAYLASDGTLHGSSSSHTSVPSANNGVDIYDKLVSKYSNIQLVISGHNISSNLVHRQDAREDGSVVTSLLVDPQTFDSQNNGETGMVCMLYFSEDGNTVNVEWYSTVRDQYYKSNNQYTLKLNEMPSADGGIVTKYGTIPAAYTDADSYPFVVFVDGEFTDLGAYDPFNYASGTLERALRKIAADKNVVIVARKNFTIANGSNGYFPSNYMQANITIDLMGYTLTGDSANLISSAASQTFSTNLTVKNGTINLSAALLSVSAGGGEKTQNFTFENLDIISNHKELIIFNQYREKNNVNIDFEDCDIAFLSTSGFAGNVFRSGSSGDTTPKIMSSLTVHGGSVTLPSFDSSKFVQENNGSIVTFLPNDNGEFTKVIVPTGTEKVGEKSYRGNNEAALALVKTAVTAAGDEYTLIETKKGGIETPYGIIPMEYASVVDYPFVAFDKTGKVVKTATNIFIDESGSFERAIRNITDGEEIIVILRRDFELPKQGFFYTNYAKLPVTIDLMGHTVTNTYSENLFSSNGTQAHESTITVKNGTLILGKALYSVSTHANAPGKTQNMIFENLNISISWNHVSFHNSSNSAGNVNISYINCNFNLTNTGVNVFSAGKSATDTNIVTHITVKGGSITLAKFDAARFANEYNGGSVTFLPNDEGEYLVLKAPTSSTVSGSYTTDKGAFTYVRSGSDDGYNVYLLRNAAQLVSAQISLTMNTGFTYNIYVPQKDFITSITLGGQAYDLSTLPTKEIDGVTYWHIELYVEVAKSAEKIALVVEGKTQTQTWTFSVVSYANKLVEGEYTNVEKQLARDILAYVRATYVYANNESTAEVVNSINAIIGADYAVDPVIGEVKENTNGLNGAGLYLAYKPAFYFRPEYDADLYTFTVNGAEVITEVTSINGELAILVYTYAYAVTETITYTIEGTDISGEYNLAAYLAFAENYEDPNVAELVKALWQYSESAKAYGTQSK